jgi:AcrR family transcriptional regulator
MDKLFIQLSSDAHTTKERLFVNAIWLFSSRGVNGVGIREICQSVDIKESSFYNHFLSKEQLLNDIFTRYLEIGEMTIMTTAEFDEILNLADVAHFFSAMMEKFLHYTDNPLFQMMRRIVLMESFINPKAAEVAKKNLYYFRKESMEQGLRWMLEKGLIRELDVSAVTVEYCYAASEMLDEFLLLDFWQSDTSGVTKKLTDHIAFYTNLIVKKNGKKKHSAKK